MVLLMSQRFDSWCCITESFSQPFFLQVSRLCTLVAVLLLTSSVATAAAVRPLQEKENLVFIGDESLSVCAAVLAKEYKSDFSSKKSKFTIIKKKKGTWISLQESLAKDLKKGKVDKGAGGRVIIALGLYDACDVRKGTGPVTPEADLAMAIDSVLTQCLALKLTVILCTPAAIDVSAEGQGYVDTVAAQIRTQAQKHNVECIDFRVVAKARASKDTLVKKGIQLNEKGVTLFASMIEPFIGVVSAMLDRELVETDRIKIVSSLSRWRYIADEIQENGREEIGAGFSCDDFRFQFDALSGGNSAKNPTKQNESIALVANQKATVIFLVCGGGNMARFDFAKDQYSASVYEGVLLRTIEQVQPVVSDFFLVTMPPLGKDPSSKEWAMSQEMADIVRKTAKKKRISLIDGHKICLDWMDINGYQPMIGMGKVKADITDIAKDLLSSQFHAVLGLGHKTAKERRKEDLERRQTAAKTAAEERAEAKKKTTQKDADAKKDTKETDTKQEDKEKEEPKINVDDLDLDSLE